MPFESQRVISHYSTSNSKKNSSPDRDSLIVCTTFAWPNLTLKKLYEGKNWILFYCSLFLTQLWLFTFSPGLPSLPWLPGFPAGPSSPFVPTDPGGPWIPSIPGSPEGPWGPRKIDTCKIIDKYQIH